MLSANTLRVQIEQALAHKIPSALTPAPRVMRPIASTGIPAVDELLSGGLPLGAITEIVGPECSGGVSFALSFAARITQAGKVCAWIDVSDGLHPESVVGMGVEPKRLLWVRCGVTANAPARPQAHGFILPQQYLIPKPVKKGLHGGGFGGHPRGEVKGLSAAVSGLLHNAEAIYPRCAEPIKRPRPERQLFAAPVSQPLKKTLSPIPGKSWSRIEQALKVTDLILQGGGFSAVVLDMGSLAPEYVSRVPLATWFRYRAAAEKSQASILLLTQHPSAKSSAGLVLRMHSEDAKPSDRTVFTGIRHQVEVVRQRFEQAPSNVIPLRKPPQSTRTANWQTRTVWAGRT